MNKLVTLNKNDKREEYRPIIKIELKDNTYIIYTKNEVNDIGDTICYAASYVFDGKQQSLKPVEDDSILEFLDEILLNLVGRINRESEEV